MDTQGLRGVSAVKQVNQTKRSLTSDEGPHDQGFTLVELLIVVTIIPLIVGAISLGLISMFTLQSSVSNRIADTADAQVVSSTFLKDVQSSQMITTQNSSSPQCGTGTQLLGLEWSGTASKGFQTVVSYDDVAVTNGSTTTYSLVRQYCTYGNTTPTSTQTVSYDVTSSQLPPCLTSTTCTPSGTQTAWTAASGVPAVRFVIDETKSPFLYTLVATPRAWNGVGVPTGGQQPFSPLTLLGAGCNDLSVSNNATLSVNVGGGTGNGQIAIDSTCAGSGSIGNNGTLAASSVVTASTGLNSMSGKGSYPSTEYYANSFPNPLASLVAPTPASSPVSCKHSGNLYTCSPGYYATDPGFANGSTIVFTGDGTYTFNQNFTIPNNATATFDTGTYMFEGTGGSNAFTTGTSGITITGNHVLFYVPTGNVNFSNNSSISISPESGYSGVSIWAAGNGVTVNLANNSSEVNFFGGVYVPNGTVTTTNNGTMATEFIVASTASFYQNTVINITSS